MNRRAFLIGVSLTALTGFTGFTGSRADQIKHELNVVLKSRMLELIRIDVDGDKAQEIYDVATEMVKLRQELVQING